MAHDRPGYVPPVIPEREAEPQPVRLTTVGYVRSEDGVLWRAFLLGFSFAAGATAFGVVVWIILGALLGMALQHALPTFR